MEQIVEFPLKTIELNEEQYDAVTQKTESHQRILAAAGSGKTTTLTARIAWLISVCGVPAKSIVLVTFSRNAANQMRQRVESLLGSSEIWVGTFHGLARNLLAQYSPSSLQKLYFIDELVLMGTSWLESPKGRKWVAGLRYIVVDEFQDINASQWRMIERMLHPGAFLIVVGDDAQNIYTWRGSNVSFILDLHKKLPRLVDNQLRANYRSSSSIVHAANGVLRHIPSLPWKGTMIPKRAAGPRPEVHFFWRTCDETAWVLRRVSELEKQNPQWSFAVLSRTNSDLYRIEETLQAKGRPYRLHDILDEGETEKIPGTLDLVTLHASKGLEWDCVFLIGCNDDSFPAKKAAEDIVCERRLFYVGVTRARNMLYLTYTKKERALTRFIREIPCSRLLFMGLARYTLSDIDRAEGRARLMDILGSLDGNALQELRKAGRFRTIERENWSQTQIFSAGLWKVPAWAAIYDKGGDFYRFLRLWLYRHTWKTLSQEEVFHEPNLERILFTLRVYAEEREFFEQWSSEIREMLHVWFGERDGDDLRAVEFGAVQAWAAKKNLYWTTQDIVKATTLLAKLRGQLRPLRFVEYDLNEFRIGSARYIVPTEWRAETLKSWRRVCSRDLDWHDVIVDLWRLGALTLCAEGRNAALYRVIEMSQQLLKPEIIDFLEQLEYSVGPWLAEQGGDIQFGLELANQELFTDQLDIVSNGVFWRICVEGKMDALQILELAVRGSLARIDGIPLRAVGWIHPIDGSVVRLGLNEDWDQDVQEILEAAQG